MLKNKFGMTKILVLVLSVLMLVSLVACNKADGPSTDDMNAAIQAAIDAANAEQAAKEAALAASIAADKAAQEAKDAALAESIAKEKAENDAALKKAQEEAKAAADAAAAASKAAKEAADKAAKEAADAAAKAAKEAADKAAKEASEAAKKAQEEADKQASELAAALEAAKAEALKAQEEASKAAAEASKAIAEASKAAEEAAKASSQLAETTVPAETTVVAPGETTVVTPAVPVDKTEVLAAFSKLKTEYTYTKQAMYNAAEYAELVLLFDKASLDLNNAASVEAATAVLETLKVDAAAVRSVEVAAAEVAALINALGDIETEVFTTQAEMIVKADEAYADLLDEYSTYFFYDVEDETITNETEHAKRIKALGINVADLAKADSKLIVLEKYIETALQAKFKEIYLDNTRMNFRPDINTALAAKVRDAYYLYQVLSVVNGGDVDAANLPIAWEYALDDDGKVERVAKNDDGTLSPATDPLGRPYTEGARVYDAKKPTDYFTAENFIEIYALPTLDYDFSEFKKDVVEKLTEKLDAVKTALATAIKNDSKAYLIENADLEYMFTDAAIAFDDAILGLSFVEDYKGNNTLDDAKADVWTKMAVAYVDAVNAIITESKKVAVTEYTYAYELAVENTENEYSDDKYQNAVQQAYLAKKLAQLAAEKDAFLANVDAAPVYTFEALNTLENRTAFGNKVDNKVVPYKELSEYIDETGIDAKFYEYVNKAVYASINDNFVEQRTGESKLGDYILELVTDLTNLRSRLDPTDETEVADDMTSIYLYQKDGKYVLAGTPIAYADGTGYKTNAVYSNTVKFSAMVATIDKAIADIEAIDVETFTDKATAVTFGDNKGTYGEKTKNAAIYWINEEAKNVALKDLVDADGKIDQAVLEAKVAELAVANKAADKNWTSAGFLTINKTDYPIEFIYTAEEQALAKAYELYTAAYTSIHTELTSISGIVATQKKLVTDNAAYKAVKSNVSTNAALTEEVEAFATIYTDKIAAENTLAKSMTGNTFAGKAKINQTLKATHFEFVEDVVNAANYVVDGVADDMKLVGDAFVAAFGTDDIVKLYNYRQSMIAAVKAEVAKFLNSYKSETNSVTLVSTPVQVRQQAGWTYDTGLTAPSAAGAAYEAQVAAKLNECIAAIEAVRLNSAAEVKDYLDQQIIAKNDAVTLAAAKDLVNAYAVKLLGYDIVDSMTDLSDAVQNKYLLSGTTWTAAKVAGAEVAMSYSNAASQLFQAFKVYYLGNYETLKNTNLTAVKANGDFVPAATGNVTLAFTWTVDGETQVQNVTYDPAGTINIVNPSFPAVEGKVGYWNVPTNLADIMPGKTIVVRPVYVDIYKVSYYKADSTFVQTDSYIYFEAVAGEGRKAYNVPANDFATTDLVAYTAPAVDTVAGKHGEWDGLDLSVNNTHVTAKYTDLVDVIFDVDGVITTTEDQRIVKVPTGWTLAQAVAAELIEMPAAPQKAADANAFGYIGAWGTKTTTGEGEAAVTTFAPVDMTAEVEASVTYTADFTPYYAVKYNYNDGTAATSVTYYFKAAGDGYAWFIREEDAEIDGIVAHALPTLRENTSSKKYSIEAFDLTKVTTANLAKLSEVSEVETTFATATYIRNNVVVATVEYTIKLNSTTNANEVVILSGTIPTAATGKVWRTNLTAATTIADLTIFEMDAPTTPTTPVE